MAIFNLGSVNVDHFYEVAHLPAPGETIAATNYRTELGGKGANQSVAAARAGAVVRHIGALGDGAERVRDELMALGVDATFVSQVPGPQGQAVIYVDPQGENSIVLMAGVNRQIDAAMVKHALAHAQTGDILLLQNETSAQAEAARLAREKGMFVIYSAAPFDVDAVRAVAPYVDMLVMNQIEAQQLEQSLGQIDVQHRLITKGAAGAEWHFDAVPILQPGFNVNAVDTTGAGDCFIGALAAAMDRGQDKACALQFAVAASALQVTKAGTAKAMPERADIESFLVAQ